MQLDDYTPEKIKRKINGFLIFTILKLLKKIMRAHTTSISNAIEYERYF